MNQNRTLLFRLLDTVINYLSQNKDLYSPEVIRLLSEAKNLLLEPSEEEPQKVQSESEENGDKTDHQKKVGLGKDFTNPDKNNILKKVKDRVDFFSQITKDSHKFQLELNDAAEKAELTDSINGLKNNTVTAATPVSGNPPSGT